MYNHFPPEYEERPSPGQLKAELTLANAADWLEGVLEAVYDTGDGAALEEHLEELCHALSVPFPADKARKLRGSSPLMQWYLGYQRAHLDRITDGGR